jgi:hypothetical protein
LAAAICLPRTLPISVSCGTMADKSQFPSGET